ncbi:MAG: hypothetical protein WBY44_11975 [Bryobacteraceae bacterium]
MRMPARRLPFGIEYAPSLGERLRHGKNPFPQPQLDHPLDKKCASRIRLAPGSRSVMPLRKSPMVTTLKL